MAQSGSFPDAHINDGDYLLVDVRREAEHENIVAIEVGDELYIKRLMIQGDRIGIIPYNENDDIPPFNTLDDINIYGVVTWVAKKLV